MWYTIVFINIKPTKNVNSFEYLSRPRPWTFVIMINIVVQTYCIIRAIISHGFVDIILKREMYI